MKWGPGDAYECRGASAQLRAMRYAKKDVRLCEVRERACDGDEHPTFCCAWRVGHHAGRIFAMRERARDGKVDTTE